jgi:hypothetical protein
MLSHDPVESAERLQAHQTARADHLPLVRQPRREQILGEGRFGRCIAAIRPVIAWFFVQYSGYR